MCASKQERPLRIINSVAPIRICDNGGWTDTWFAQQGRIFNIAVHPSAEVQIEVFPHGEQESRIILHAENYGERYAVHPETSAWGRHPLLEAAIERMAVPEEMAFEASVFCGAPAGASTGTSAAVAVALIGALDCLTSGRLTPHEIAYVAHSVEVDMLDQQSGIQDQLCSAYGGINYVEMAEYPYASVSQIQVPDPVWWELERSLVLIYLGSSHSSSEVHEKVIEELKDAGPNCKQLDDLRVTAGVSRDAVVAGDLTALGRAMVQNMEAQARLHPDLISQDARRVIEIARSHGALGWKVNGAGGEGGSVTILAGSRSHAMRSMIREMEGEDPLFRNIPIHLSRHGLRTWDWV